MDADRLGRGEQIAGICAVLLFIFMFFNWFSLPDEVNGVPTGVGLAEAAGIDTSINAWQAYDFTDLILLVTEPTRRCRIGFTTAYGMLALQSLLFIYYLARDRKSVV